jgi:hypothetical protein
MVSEPPFDSDTLGTEIAESVRNIKKAVILMGEVQGDSLTPKTEWE